MPHNEFTQAFRDEGTRETESLRRLFTDLTVGDTLWLVLFNLLLFQIYLQEEIGGIFSYIDECSALLILAITVGALITHRHDEHKAPQGVVVPLIFLVCALALGLISNFTSGVSVAPRAIAIDVFTFCKFPMVMLCGAVMPQRGDRRDSLWRLVVMEARILIVIMAFCALATFLFGSRALHMGYDIRYGRTSFKFIFYHPEVVNLFTLGLIAILLIDRPEGHRALVLLALAVMCSTLRAKAMAFAALAFVVIMTSRHGRISLFAIACGAVCAIYVAGDQLSIYYESGDSARSTLTADGTLLANRYAPLGSGFATFGSAVTAGESNYSPLYYELGYQNIWGLSPLTCYFISDTFWPVIMAQLGYCGAACYTIAVVLGFMLVFRRYALWGRNIAVVLLAAYLAICTTASSAVFAPQWIYLLTVLYLGVRHLDAVAAEVPSRGDRSGCDARQGAERTVPVRKRGAHAA